jgi:hypothetical protein
MALHDAEQGLRFAAEYIGQSWLSSNGSFALSHVMPASITFFQTCLLLWAACARWSLSVPLKRADCPGYKASNVRQTDNSVTADLTLAGSECNIYGKDLKDLKFVAEYQTGRLPACFPFFQSADRCFQGNKKQLLHLASK